MSEYKVTTLSEYDDDGREITKRIAIVSNKKLVASIFPNQGRPDAQIADFICRACNCHDELVETCRQAVRMIEELTDFPDGDGGCDYARDIKATIAKATK